MAEQQTASAVLMIRPAAFSGNPETASSNHFQLTSAFSQDILQSALSEFDLTVTQLRREGVDVVVLNDTPSPQKPDAVFPNNWLSTHADGSVVLYPMLAKNRRLERRIDVLRELRARDYSVTRLLDFSDREAHGLYLEGTGSLVLDRANRIAYACRSPRTAPDVLEEFASTMGYRAVLFDACDPAERPFYHTNVIMSVGRKFAAVCLECIEHTQAEALRNRLHSTGHEIIELSFRQVLAFAGNILELATPDGHCVVLSDSAAEALSPMQRSRLELLGGPLARASIPTIERYGGGSVRCMIAEIHLPRCAETDS